MIGYCRAMRIVYSEEVEWHLYGIELLDSELGVLERAPDLTPNWRKICRYTGAMNRLELSPLHFWDVVEDICLDCFY